MKNLKNYFLTLTLVFCSFTSWAQGKEQKDFEYFSLNTQGSITSNPKGKETKIYVFSGFIQIKPTGLTTTQYTTRTYFTSKSGKNEKPNINSLSNEVYLRLGDIYSIDILDRKTDQLIHRYTIYRSVKYPDIEVILLSNGQEKAINSKGETTVEVNTTNAKSVALKRKDTTQLNIEYKLLNLKTKKTVDNNLLKDNLSLNLQPNTEYELSVNYAIQPESVRTFYIKNEAAWYQNTNNYLAVGVILLAIIVALILKKMTNKVRVSNSEIKKMEASAIRLQSMLNPHFTFNALSTVQGLMNTGRIDEANLYLENFGSLLRQSLAKSQELYHPLHQELEMMRMYLSLEALRFNFEWHIEVDEGLQTTEIDIPTLLLQPLIENAVKHGLKNVTKGHISVTCTALGDSLVVKVADNGSWIENPAGYGLHNIRERIATISKMRDNQGITLNFDSSEGTTATLTFFNWLKND